MTEWQKDKLIWGGLGNLRFLQVYHYLWSQAAIDLATMNFDLDQMLPTVSNDVV